jgi:hypothetical protein
LNHQNLSIERYRVRGADHPTSKSQLPRAKAPRGRDFARACHDGPIAIVRHAAVFFAFAAALSLTNCKEFVREMWERAMRAGIVAAGVALAVGVGACSTIPRVELTAYAAAYADIQSVTNGVLDIIAPYERVVIRFAARNTASLDTIPVAAASNSASEKLLDAMAQANPAPAPGTAPSSQPGATSAPAPTGAGAERPPRPTPQVDPGLLGPKQGAARPPRPTPQIDESLLLPKQGTVRPARPAPQIDPDLLADPAVVNRPRRTGSVIVARPCRAFGADPYCYEMRDGFADIGDPPLVGAYRNLANVILRFNTLLVAYSDGISGRLLRQEIEGFTSSITEISRLVPITNISGAGTFAASFTGIVNSLLPLADLAGGVVDRAQLRIFLLDNYEIVDQALLLMALNSSKLYANVYVGTQLFQIKTRGAGENLNTRRREIRRLIANWTVLLDDTRRILRELKIAIEASDGLETRMRNLEATVISRINTSAIKKEIATLGTPTLPP